MVILTLTALATGAYGTTATANYYQFYSSLQAVRVNLTSLHYVADNRSLNGTVTFTLANPSNYKGLGLGTFKMDWEIDGMNGTVKLPQGVPNLPLGMPKTLDPTQPFTIILQGGGDAPRQVFLIRSIGKDVEFIFHVDLVLSSFLDSVATAVTSYNCMSQEGPGTCQHVGIEIFPQTRSGGGGGGGGV